MTKKNTIKKSVKKSVKGAKPTEVVIVEPKVEDGEFKLKREPENTEPVIDTPAPPVQVEPEINPNDPRTIGLSEGLKRPSVSSQIYAYTKKQYENLIEAYKKQNPVKYNLKKVELEKKLKEIK